MRPLIQLLSLGHLHLIASVASEPGGLIPLPPAANVSERGGEESGEERAEERLEERRRAEERGEQSGKERGGESRGDEESGERRGGRRGEGRREGTGLLAFSFFILAFFLLFIF